MDTNAARDWARSWMALGARGCPGQPEGFDRAAFEQALEDLAVDGVDVPSDPGDLDLLGELAERMDRVVPSLLRRALADSQEARAAMEEIALAFRTDAGPALRARRRPAIESFLEALAEPLERRLANLERTRLRRGWRLSKRHRGLPNPELSRDPAAMAPDDEALAQELGVRAAARVRAELAPRTLAAVARRLRETSPAPELSPATMCRALQKVRSIAAEEFQGCSPALLDAFWAALLGSLPRA